MNNTIKKSIVIFISLAFLLSGVTISSAENLKYVSSTEESNVKETSFTTKTIILYRYGPAGGISTVKVDVNLEKGQDIGEAIADKCDELFEKDAEMQNLLKISNFTLGLFCKVKSSGRGFHYKAMLLEKLLLRFTLFRLGLPRVSTILRRPLIVCKYTKDLKAKTTITPLIRKNATAKTVSGNHTVIVNNFIGYTTWIGRFSKSPLDLLPRSFSGMARFAICNKLP